MKPVYKITIIVGATLLIGIGAYFAWNALVGPSEREPETPPISGTLPPPEETGSEPPAGESPATVPMVKKLSDNDALFFWIASDTNEVHYITPQGAIFSLKEGPDLEVSNEGLDAIRAVTPSLRGNKVLAEFGNPLSPKWGVFDLNDKVWRPLPSDIIRAIWGANENELIATVAKEEETAIVRIDISKNPPAYTVILRDFRVRDAELVSKSPEEILFVERAGSAYPARVWQLNIKTLAINTLTQLQRGLLFSFASKKQFAFMYSAPTRFSVVDGNFSELFPAVFWTFPSKCDGAGAATALCFVPRKELVPENAVLPDDYLKRSLYTVDDLYMVQLDEGATPVAVQNIGSVPSIDATGVVEDGGTLYFINRYDNRVYSIENLPE